MLVSQENRVPTRLHHLSHSAGSCIYFCILNAVKQLQRKGPRDPNYRESACPRKRGMRLFLSMLMILMYDLYSLYECYNHQTLNASAYIEPISKFVEGKWLRTLGPRKIPDSG